MQKEIHPDNRLVDFTCACGNVCTTNTTKKGDKMTLDICSKCHPFFTKKQKVVDSSGKLDRFNKRVEAAKKDGKK